MKRTAARIAAFALSLTGFALAPAPSSAQLCQVLEGVYTGARALDGCVAGGVEHVAGLTIELIDDHGKFQLNPNPSLAEILPPVTATSFAGSARTTVDNGVTTTLAITASYTLYTRPNATVDLDGGSAAAITGNFYVVTARQRFAATTTDVAITVLRTGLAPELACAAGLGAGTYAAGSPIPDCHFRIATNTPDADPAGGTLAGFAAFTSPDAMPLLPAGPDGLAITPLQDKVFSSGVQTLTVASLLEGGLLGREDEFTVTVYDYINDVFRFTVAGTVTTYRAVDICSYPEHNAGAVKHTMETTMTLQSGQVSISTSVAILISPATGCQVWPARSYRSAVTMRSTVTDGVTTRFTVTTAEALDLPAGRMVTLSLANLTGRFAFAGGDGVQVAGAFTDAVSINAKQDRKFNHQEQAAYLLTIAQSSGGARLRDILLRVELVNAPPQLRGGIRWPDTYETNPSVPFVLPLPDATSPFQDVEGTKLRYEVSMVTPANAANWLDGRLDGAFTGDPPRAGTYAFAIRASDGAQTSQGAFSITVSVTADAPTLAFEMDGSQTLELIEDYDLSGRPVGFTFPASYRGGVRILGDANLLKGGTPFTIIFQPFQPPSMTIQTSLHVLRVKRGNGGRPVILDYEAKTAYTLTLQAFAEAPSGFDAPAGAYAIGTVTLTVVDVNDSPHSISLTGLARDFDEGSLAAGETIDTGYRITVTDADSAEKFSHEYDFSVPALTVEGDRVLVAGPGSIDYEAGHRIATLVVRDAQPYNAGGDRRAATVQFMLGLRDVPEGGAFIVKDPPVLHISEGQTVFRPFSDWIVAEDLRLVEADAPDHVLVESESYTSQQLAVRISGATQDGGAEVTLVFNHRHGDNVEVTASLRITRQAQGTSPRVVVRERPSARLPLVVTEPVYLHSGRDAISYHHMGPVLASDNMLLAETGSGSTIQLPARLYNQHLISVLNDERFAVDYGDLHVDGDEQRIRGIYAKPGAVFDSGVAGITLRLEVKDGVDLGYFIDEHMRYTLSVQRSTFSVLNELPDGHKNPSFDAFARSIFTITLDMFAPGVAVEGAQEPFGARAGIVDTGFTLVATNVSVDGSRSDALRFASSSPAVVLPSEYTEQRRIPIMMDVGLAAASPDLTRDQCGALALPVTLHAEFSNVRSNEAVVSIRVAPGPARLRGRPAVTLSAGVALVAAPTGYELDCLAPDVEAFFTDSRFTLESGAGPTRRIMLKAGAVMAAGEREAVVTLTHRQGGGAQTGRAVLRLPVDSMPGLRALAYAPGRHVEGDVFLLKLGQLFAGGSGVRDYRVSFSPGIDFSIAAGLLRAPLTLNVPNVGDQIINFTTGMRETVTLAVRSYEITVVASDQADGLATAFFTVTANKRVNPPTDTKFPSVEFGQARYLIEPGLTLRSTTYIHWPGDLKYHGLAPFQAKDFTLSVFDADNPFGGGPLTLSSFTLGPEQANEQMVRVLDDRFGVDFSDISAQIEPATGSATNTVQWTRGVYIKPGAVFPGGPLSLTLLVRGAPDPRNFSAPGLSETLAGANIVSYASTPQAELLLGHESRAGVVTVVLGLDSLPRLAVVGEQAIIDPLARNRVATGLTLVKTFHSGSLRYQGEHLRLIGHDQLHNPDSQVRFTYAGDDASEFPITVDMGTAHRALRSAGCGKHELPLTISAEELQNQLGSDKTLATIAFTLTLGGALGDELPSVSGAARTRGPADVEADFATGLAFECAGPDFFFSSTNEAFALAGEGERRGIVVRAGAANDAPLTTRITYRQRAGGREGSFDLTIGTRSTIAVEGPSSPPPVAAADRPRLWISGTLAAIPGPTLSGDFQLEGGGAAIEYGGIGTFLRRGFTLTTYHEAAGATVYATTAFDAAAYNERLVRVDDDRFGIDFTGYAAAGGRQSFRGLYVKDGAVFSDDVVTVTLMLNSGAYLKDFATGALRRRIEAGEVALLDPEVAGASFANEATAAASVTLWVAPQAFVSGTQATVEIGAGKTSAVDSGLRLSVALPGDFDIVSQHPAIKLGNAGGVSQISVLRSSIDLNLHAAPMGCGLHSMPATLSVVSDANANAHDVVSFLLTLYDDSVISDDIRPNAVAGAAPELTAGTLTAQVATGHAFECANSNFVATFENDAFELVGAGLRREIALKNGATITAPAMATRVFYAQAGGRRSHTLTVSLAVYSTLAWTGPTSPPGGSAASIQIDGRSIGDFALRPNATVTVRTPINGRRDIAYQHIDAPLAADVVVTLVETAADATVTARFTISPSVYSKALFEISDDRFSFDVGVAGSLQTSYFMQPIYAKPGARFDDRHVTLTIVARSGAYLDEIDHPALSAYLAGARGTVIFRDPGVRRVGFANHSQATATLAVAVAPQLALLGTAGLVVSSGASDPTGVSLRVSHGEPVSSLLKSDGFDFASSIDLAIGQGMTGINVDWANIDLDSNAECGVNEKVNEIVAVDLTFSEVRTTLRHTVSVVAGAPNVGLDDKPYVTGSLTLGFLTPGTLAADLRTGLSVACRGAQFSNLDRDGFDIKVDPTDGATWPVFITAGHVVPADQDVVHLSVVAHNGGSNSANRLTVAYSFPVSTTVAIHRPDDISFSSQLPALAIDANARFSVIQPGTAAASLRLHSGGGVRFVRTEPLLAGTHFSLTLRSGGVATAFTVATELYNTLILGLDDDRIGYDFGGLRKAGSAAEYHAAGFFVKAGANLPPRQITLTLEMRSGAYVSEIEHPGLAAYLAANPNAELANPGARGPGGTPVRFRLTATAQFALTFRVAPRLAVTGAPRRLDAATITGAAGTGVTVRVDYDRTGVVSLSPGVELGAGNELLLNPRAEGLERIAGACGEVVVPATVAVRDKEASHSDLRAEAVFSITVYDAQAIGGGQVPAIASGPTARLEAGGQLAAAVPTGFAFGCAGGSFEASFSNDAFALAGAAPRFSVLIKRGEVIPAGATSLTTRITYRQNAKAAVYHTDLTVLVGGSIALSPPSSLPSVPAAQRPTVEFSGQPTPIEAGAAYAAAARLHAGPASYRNMDAFLSRNLDLTVYELSGGVRSMTNYFEIAASLYNSRLVEFSDSRFGADARGVFIRSGASFAAAPLTLTLTLNSGAHLGALGHSALDAFLAAAGGRVLEARDPAVSGNGFALTASTVVELPLRVRPIVALDGTQASLDAASQTGFTDTGLRLTATYGGALEHAVRPDLFALGAAGAGGHAISIDMGRLAEARTRNEGCGLYAIDGTASFHPAGDAGAAKEAVFAVTLHDPQRIRLTDSPTIAGFQSVALDAGTLTADFDTGLGFECAAAGFSATFPANPHLTHAAVAVDGRYAISLKAGAVIDSETGFVAVAVARQGSNGPERLLTLTLQVNQSIAIEPPSTLPPVAPADLPRIEASVEPAPIQPNHDYAARAYLHEADEVVRFFNIGRFQTRPFALTIRELTGGATIEHAFTIAAQAYNSRLVAGFSDSRFGIDFADAAVDGDGGQRVRGVYIRQGARFASEAITLSITLNSGAYPSQIPDAGLAALLARGGNLQALLPRVPGLNLAATAAAVVELTMRVAPDAAADGTQLSIDATRTQGVVDTGLRLQASYQGAALEAAASPDVFVLGAPAAGIYPLRMDMSRLAAAPQDYGSCGDFAVPGSATFQVATDAGLRTTVRFSVTLFDPRKIRTSETPELTGAPTVTLQRDMAITEPLPIGMAFECAGPNFSLRSTPDIFSLGGAGARRALQLSPITLTVEGRMLTAQIVYSQGGAATYTANVTIDVAGPLATIQAHANRLAREVARASSSGMLRSVNKRIDLGAGGGALGLDRAAADELLRMIGNKEKELEEGGASLRELLAGQDFSLPLAANGAGAPGASVWGQADVHSLDREADDFSYDGALFSGLLGFDYRAGGVLFGLVAGHHSGEFTQIDDDDPNVFANDMQTLAPYFAVDLDGGGRVLAMAGAGAGEMVISKKDTEEEVGRTDTSLVFYSMGYRQDLGLESGRLLFKSDFAGNQLSIEGDDSELSYDEADNSIWQMRIALEIARGVTQGPVRIEPSLELAARLDIHDDDIGPTERDAGYEAILGLEYDGGGRLRGRMDASLVKLGEDLESFGLGLGLRYSPGAGQLGLGFDLEPRYGALATAGSLYDEDATLEELRARLAADAAAPGLSASSSLRYGFGLPGRVAAPYLTYRLHEETADYVLGIRIHRGAAERWTMSYAPHEDGLMQLRYRLGY